MVQMTVLKVDIACEKCKQKLMKAVSGLEGVDKIEADASKNTLTVTGDADPIEVIVRTRRTGKHAEVVSVGPPPATPKAGGGGGGQKKAAAEGKQAGEEKKVEEKALFQMPSTCHICQQMGFLRAYVPCSIL